MPEEILENILDKPVDFAEDFESIIKQEHSSEGIKRYVQRLQRIIEKIGEGVTLSDIEGHFEIYNSRMQEITGYTMDEANSCDDFVNILYPDPEERKKTLDNINEVVHNGKSNNVETKIQTKDGRKKTLLVSTSIIQYKNFDMFLSIYRDITEHKNVEEKLRESEKRYRSVIETAVEGIIIADENLSIVSWNNSAAKLFGYKKEEILGKPLWTLMPEQLRSNFFENMKSHYLAGNHTAFAGRVMEYIGLKKDGSKFIAEISISTFELDGKRFFISFNQDITERKKMQEQYKILFNSSPDAIILFAEDGKILSVNSSMSKNLGASAEDLIGENIHKVLPKDVDERRTAAARKALETGEIQEEDDTQNGRFFHNSFVPIFTPDGNKSVQMIARDITDIKESELLLKESEEKFRTISSSAQDGIIMMDNDGNVTYWNEAAEKIFGYKPDDIIGKNLHMVIAPEKFHEAHKKAFSKFKDTGKGDAVGKTLELSGLRKDGTELPVELSLSSVKIKDKWNAIGIIRDITKRKKAEERLNEAKQELEAKNQQLEHTVKHMDQLTLDIENTLTELDQIFNIGVDGIIVVDKEFRILRINDTFSKMVGISKARFLGKKCYDVLKLQICKSDSCPLKNMTNVKEYSKYDVAIKRPDDTEIPCVLKATPYRRLGGEIVGVVANFRDITEQKEIEGELKENAEHFESINKELMEAQEMMKKYVNQLHERTSRLEFMNNELTKSKEKIQQQNVKLKNLDQLKSAFLNITSHELRTPMSSIKGYVQMLLKQTLGDVTEEQRKGLEVVLRNTNRLDHLIQDILDISRLESGTMKFIPERTDIHKMIDEVAETTRSYAKLKEIKIEADVEDEIPELSIDQDRVKQVIINLINNATKFSSDGSVIKLRVKKEKEDVMFEVQDFGRGIPKDKQMKIFDTFYQVDSGVDRKFGGAGLGLAISRGIILAHGGKIWVESNPGAGSTFRFTLPVKPVEGLEDRFKDVDVFRLKAIS